MNLSCGVLIVKSATGAISGGLRNDVGLLNLFSFIGKKLSSGFRSARSDATTLPATDIDFVVNICRIG